MQVVARRYTVTEFTIIEIMMRCLGENRMFI
jgi:hypothetical protein